MRRLRRLLPHIDARLSLTRTSTLTPTAPSSPPMRPSGRMAVRSRELSVLILQRIKSSPPNGTFW
ncbi:MAG: hypothetical protein MZV64_60210 [Ignavibacteriales bacterium]|nr:hypothetical protein [Ignavibacteriales bacterium]